MSALMRLRVSQVLDHCLLQATRTVTLSAAGLLDGEPVTVLGATAQILAISPGGGDLYTVRLIVHLELLIGGAARTAAVLVEERLRLAGLGCPGASLRVGVRQAFAGAVTLTGFGREWLFPGPVAGGQFGLSVALIGDVDGDGFPDMAVGAPSTPVAGHADTGRVYVYSLRTGALLWQADGPDPGGEFGFVVAAIGDVDGDGVPDLLVGATQTSPGGVLRAGSAFVLSGSDGAVIRRHDGLFPEGLFGWAVAGLGADWNGDGVHDYAVGAPSEDPGGQPDAGTVYVYDGATGALIRQLDGAAAGEAFGFALSSVGDLDLDGGRELAVGVLNASPPGLDEAGEVRVYNQAGALILAAAGDQPGQGFGWVVADAGDWDNDGTPDLLVGAPSTNVAFLRDAGAIYVISGATGAVLQRFDGTQKDGAAGAAVAGLGDLDGDGRVEIAYGAPHTSQSGPPLAGRVVLLEAPGAILEQLNGPQANDNWGWVLASLDGLPPEFSGFALGAPIYDTEAGTDAGLVLVRIGSQRAHCLLHLCLEFSVERPVCISVRGHVPNCGVKLGVSSQT